MKQKIGILALQGDFEKHAAMLESMAVDSVFIKRPAELASCSGLIIPGGESTVMSKLMHTYGFYEPIREFAEVFPVMGTCAGLIMMASCVDDHRVTPLNLMDITVSRNAYGRQIDSFTTTLDAQFLNDSPAFKSVFIRAPKIQSVGPDVTVLMTHRETPVMIRSKKRLALSFHPELGQDDRIHRYFLSLVEASA